MTQAAISEGPKAARDSQFQLVTVVVPALNAEATIGEQLAALAAQTYAGPWEIIVSDNGSTDRTNEIVRSWEPRLPPLRIVDSSAGKGVAHARNVAAALAGDLIVLCDADDVVTPQWLDEMVAVAADGPDIVGGALDHKSLNDPAIARVRGGSTTELQRTYHFLEYATGANCAVRREVFEALGGWDTTYARAEDVDFSWRAQLSGYTLAFAPRAVIAYRHRHSVGGVARQVYDYARAEVGLYRRYRGLGATRRTPREIARAYFYLATRLPYLLMTRKRRARWLVAAAENAGRIMGAWQSRGTAPEPKLVAGLVDRPPTRD
jgi:GT2 family glycosyltransferase